MVGLQLAMYRIYGWPDIRLFFKIRFWPKQYKVPDISVIGPFWQLVHPQNRQPGVISEHQTWLIRYNVEKLILYEVP